MQILIPLCFTCMLMAASRLHHHHNHRCIIKRRLDVQSKCKTCLESSSTTLEWLSAIKLQNLFIIGPLNVRNIKILFPISRHQNWNASRILWRNLFNDDINLSISLNAIWLLLWKNAHAIITVRICFVDQPSCANRKVIDWRLPKFIHNSI